MIDLNIKMLERDFGTLDKDLGVTNEPDYATREDHQKVVPVLFNALAQTGAIDPEQLETITGELDKAATEKQKLKIIKPVMYETGEKAISTIRTANINSRQLREAAAILGLQEVHQLTDIQKTTSGQFVVHSFLTPTGVTLTVVLAGRNKAAIAKGLGDEVVLNRKDLTPVKLNLAGEYTNRKALYDATKKALPAKVKNTNLADALIALLDLAYNRGAGQLTPEQLKFIQPIQATVIQDFGEILTPIALAEDHEDIVFPEGNAKLIDVTVGGKARYSVKGFGGSGTSMNSLGSILDDYAKTLTDEGTKKLFNDGIKIYQSTRKEGSITDRICLAAHRNAIPEYLSYIDILGGEFQSFKELETLLTPIVKNLEYPAFLKMILPAASAGHWAKPTGMPDDYQYYLGLTNIKPEPGQTGKYSYDRDPVDGAANIITYSVGKGLYNLVREGPDKDRYKEIMNDMIRQLNCQLGHITLDSAGELQITSSPFGNLEFEFDYHAPSNLAGNNRPGFIIVPPNKGKKKKSDIKMNSDEPEKADKKDTKISPMRQKRSAPDIRARRD